MDSIRRVSIVVSISVLFMLLENGAFSQVLSSSPIIQKEFGSVKTIASDTIFNVIFIYDSMRVGRFESEEMYLNQKVAEYNSEEPGKGDKWYQDWIGARQEQYEPAFIKSLNGALKRKNKRFMAGNNSKYTLVVKTTYTEPGYNIGVSKYPAKCHFEFDFVETGNPENIVLRLYVQDVEGSKASNLDFDVGSRLTKSYESAGSSLGKYLAPY